MGSRPAAFASADPRIKYVQGSIEDLSALEAAFKGAECIFHVGAPSPGRAWRADICVWAKVLVQKACSGVSTWR